MNVYKIIMILLLSLSSFGCSFYSSGIKNKPEIFDDIGKVDTYTSSYFGCEDPIQNKKPLAKQGYKLFYDNNNELWLECKDKEFKLTRKVHMGPSAFEKQIWLKGFPGGESKWNHGFTQLKLNDCSKDIICGTAARALYKFLMSTSMDKNKTCGKEDVLCASTLNPRREIRMKLDGTNILTEIADIDRQYTIYKKIVNGDLPVERLTEEDLLPPVFALEFKDEIMENIILGINIDTNKKLLAKIFKLPAQEIESNINAAIKDLATTCKAKGIADHSQDMNSVCVAYLLNIGGNVNQASESGTPPIFFAINGIKVNKEETEEYYRIVKMLISQGADLAARDNPQPLIYLKPMTPFEFLNASRKDGMFNLSAPKAPRVSALFSDKDLMSLNSKQVKYARRAEELGLTKKDYLKKLSNVDDLRKSDTFESYAEAFKLTGLKDDFNNAKLKAITKSQKCQLEFLAVLATKDKTRIFEISTSLNDIAPQTVSDDSRSDRILFVFKTNSKSSTTHFKGKSQIKISKQSPITLSNTYKLTVKYTLTIPIEQTSKVDFILSNSSTRKDVVTRTETKTFIVKTAKSGDLAVLDFGDVTIAGSSKMFGGIGKTESKLSGDPTITTEIVKVELVNG